jgi:hypothetical protein
MKALRDLRAAQGSVVFTHGCVVLCHCCPQVPLEQLYSDIRGWIAAASLRVDDGRVIGATSLGENRCGRQPVAL